jgi:uncharacterized membrane protein YtjA (UPF0391 family)
MLRIASVFLIAALSAALLGFSQLGFPEDIIDLAQPLFLIFLTLFLVSLMAGIAQQSRKPGENN